MFSELTQKLIEAIQTHGILAVIIGVAIETIIVPIPSPLILMAAGFIMITSETIASAFLHALWISVVAGLAQTIGSYFVYGIAYYGGKPLIDKFEKLHGVSWKEIETFQKKFEKKRKEEVTLGILRALPVMPLSVVSGVAGIIKMNFRKFTLATFIGVIPRNIFLALLGWQLKETYEKMAIYIDNIESVMTILVLMAIIAYILAHKFGVIDKVRKKILS
ncbi:VTT domain-containing protein [Candidatus Woesearchaeota archaeon]|nr:VTT domain-containing protein [Candidatus Woesearchaeota archaeon]